MRHSGNSFKSDIARYLRKLGAAAFTLITVLLAASCSVTYTIEQPEVNTKLKVAFIDVGQGDSIFVQCGDQSMLIDAGTNSSADEVLSVLKQEGIGKIDILVGTHPHEDHIGSLDAVIRNFEIGEIYMPKVTATTRTFKDVVTAIKEKNLKITTPVPGSVFKVGEAECTILAPAGKTYEETNNYSIVIKMVFGKTSFLFTGDAQGISEKEMLENGCDLKADVLKIGHHGSSSSTTEEFLEAVSPGYSVIMCGKDNDYKHPHKETVSRLESFNVPVYRTDECGTIVCSSDGQKISFNVGPGSYKSGK